jgi:hypothetical protein
MQWLVVPYERLGEAAAYLTGAYLVSASLSLLSGILLIWALIGLYAPQSSAAGTFGLWRSSWPSSARRSMLATTGQNCSYGQRLHKSPRT